MNIEKLNKIKSNPAEAVRVGFAMLLGYLVKLRYMTKHNVQIGSNFRAFSWLRITGPGSVVIGDRVSAYASFLRVPCIVTHTKDAIVTIGNDTNFSGTRISCVDSISIGHDALFGSTTIIDSDIIPTRDIIIDSEWKEKHVQAINIGNHIWTGVNTFILGGVTIGDESVLGAGAVIQSKEVPDRSLLVGESEQPT